MRQSIDGSGWMHHSNGTRIKKAFCIEFVRWKERAERETASSCLNGRGWTLSQTFTLTPQHARFSIQQTGRSSKKIKTTMRAQALAGVLLFAASGGMCVLGYQVAAPSMPGVQGQHQQQQQQRGRQRQLMSSSSRRCVPACTYLCRAVDRSKHGHARCPVRIIPHATPPLTKGNKKQKKTKNKTETPSSRVGLVPRCWGWRWAAGWPCP